MVHSANNNLLINLKNLPVAKQYYVAFSGGMDSTALLHALSLEPTIKERLTAIHVNHNINSAASQWADHCQRVCDAFKIPLISTSVNLEVHSEAACRAARQRIFKQHLNKDDCLLTAHHLNDQVETVLFRLFRGTGIQGLSGMSKTNNFDQYIIHRPLLCLSQKQIERYVEYNQLSFIEDPSNLDNSYKRNYIRNLIIPELVRYDSQILQNVELTAQNLNHSQQLLNHLIGINNPLDYKQFTDVYMLSTALYHWLHNLNHKQLTQYSADCLQSEQGKIPELMLDGYRLLRWQNQIYALKHAQSIADTDLVIELSANTDNIALPENGELYFKSTLQVSIPAVIRYQQSHERLQLDKNGQHKKLKNLFQQHSVPPWERKTIPYLYIDNQLMAVGSEILAYEFKSLLSEYKAEYRWLSPQYIL